MAKSTLRLSGLHNQHFAYAIVFSVSVPSERFKYPSSSLSASTQASGSPAVVFGTTSCRIFGSGICFWFARFESRSSSFASAKYPATCHLRIKSPGKRSARSFLYRWASSHPNRLTYRERSTSPNSESVESHAIHAENARYRSLVGLSTTPARIGSNSWSSNFAAALQAASLTIRLSLDKPRRIMWLATEGLFAAASTSKLFSVEFTSL